MQLQQVDLIDVYDQLLCIKDHPYKIQSIFISSSVDLECCVITLGEFDIPVLNSHCLGLEELAEKGKRN